MGKVLIVKNNNKDSDIYRYAESSLKNQNKGYYNTADGSSNEEYVKSIRNEFDGDGFLIFVTYDSTNSNCILDLYIGSRVLINDKNNIEYSMNIYLSINENERTIRSIIDKIDLDISKDFGDMCYVMMINMDNLYQELRERIFAYKSLVLAEKDKTAIKCDEFYKSDILAQNDKQAARIYPADSCGVFRTDFQRDRERVVNCKAFRRLVDKAQIFSADKGDYYRTRMTHSLEVNQIAKAISYALHLNLDLTEAIALGHDLGHTPFGHQGERTLDDILSGKLNVGIGLEKLFKDRCFGGFKHNYQSARILTQLEEKYTNYPGLNVSVQVVEGVLKHTKIKPNEISLEDFLNEKYIDKIVIDYTSEEQICSSLEGQVVAIADEIAQRGHDVDDALTSGVMSVEEFIDRLKISKCSQLENKIKSEMQKIENSERLIIDKNELQIARVVSCIVNYLITTTIQHSKDNMENNAILKQVTLRNQIKMIEFSPEVELVNSYLERVVQKKVICNNAVARADYNASAIVKTLFEKYYLNPRLLHEGTIHKIFIETLMHKNKAVSKSAINLSDGSIELVNSEIKEVTIESIDKKIIDEYMKDKMDFCNKKDIIIFEKRKILIRAITDYIAGMTDGYALEEFEKLK